MFLFSFVMTWHATSSVFIKCTESAFTSLNTVEISLLFVTDKRDSFSIQVFRYSDEKMAKFGEVMRGLMVFIQDIRACE